MDKYKKYSKMWFLVLLLVVFVAGCAENADEITDTAAPTVTLIIPANSATDVAINTTIVAAFSEAMDPTTITTGTFTLATSGGTPVTGTVTSTDTTATFTPASNLAYSAVYAATITNGVADLSGNMLASNFVWSFTTSAAPDTTAPTVSVTSPTNGAIAVPINRKINIGFSEAMEPTTITALTITLATSGGTPVPGTVTYVGTTATFVPLSNLAVISTYNATVTTGARDLAGNAMASNYTFSFTTGTGADTTAPTVSFTSPSNGITGVVLNKKINVAFSEAMDPLTITAASFVLVTNSGTPVAGTVTYVGTTATFTPLNNLTASTIYNGTITTGAKDLAENALANNYLWSFTTGVATDTTKPSVISTVNANGAINVPINTQVGATFSEDMDPLTITNLTFTLMQGSNVVSGTTGSVGANSVFTPTNDLAPSTLYNGTITTGAKDLAGNPLASNYLWGWTTAAVADATPPTVLVVNPANLANGVAINNAVSATFSEDMDPLTITTATFTLQATGPPLGPIINATVVYSAIGNIATFTPTSNLAASTNYTAMINGGTGETADISGNVLASDYVWTFTTGTGLAPGAVALGSAGTFGIMATSAITSTGATVINGDVSLDPGTSMTGFPPGTVNGAIHINDSVSAQARVDLLTAYNYAKTLPPGTTISAGADLGALYPSGIPPGTYTSGSTMLVSTPLVLDAGGNANAVWVFQIGSSLTTGASVTLANGAQEKNVFWVPTEDATIGVGTIFYGTIVSGRDVTGVTGAVINGRILAGAITAGTIALQGNTVNVPAP